MWLCVLGSGFRVQGCELRVAGLPILVCWVAPLRQAQCNASGVGGAGVSEGKIG